MEIIIPMTIAVLGALFLGWYIGMCMGLKEAKKKVKVAWENGYDLGVADERLSKEYRSGRL